MIFECEFLWMCCKRQKWNERERERERQWVSECMCVCACDTNVDAIVEANAVTSCMIINDWETNKTHNPNSFVFNECFSTIFNAFKWWLFQTFMEEKSWIYVWIFNYFILTSSVFISASPSTSIWMPLADAPSSSSSSSCWGCCCCCCSSVSHVWSSV